MWQVADYNIVALLHRHAKDLVITVHVAKEPYQEIRNAAWKNLRRLDFDSPSKDAEAEILGQLAAYQYDWKPSLGELRVPTDRLPLARFLLGGLIFGAYAQAADADHVIQDRRSQLFLAATKPDGLKGVTLNDREEELFIALKETCLRADSAARFSELPALPSILADIVLRRDPPVTRVTDILPRAIEIRKSGAGKAYRRWFTQLRSALGDGTYATAAKRDIEEVRLEAEHRLKGEYPKWGMTFTPTLSAGASLDISAEALGALSGKASVSLGEMKLVGEKLRIAIPDWIRNMIVDALPFGRHRKLLLRSALAQAEFQDLPAKLKKIWYDS